MVQFDNIGLKSLINGTPQRRRFIQEPDRWIESPISSIPVTIEPSFAMYETNPLRSFFGLKPKHYYYFDDLPPSSFGMYSVRVKKTKTWVWENWEYVPCYVLERYYNNKWNYRTSTIATRFNNISSFYTHLLGLEKSLIRQNRL